MNSKITNRPELKNHISNLYHNKQMTQQEIGVVFGVGRDTIRRFMNKYGIQTLKERKMRPERSKLWKGGKKVNVVCANCNSKKQIWNYQLYDRSYHFCNKSCFDTWQRKYLNKKINRNPNKYNSFRVFRQKIYNTPEYKKWRNYVFKRDDYRCQKCLVRGGNLEAHHVIPVKENPKMIFYKMNGLTLCRSCHRGWHSNMLKTATFAPVES